MTMRILSLSLALVLCGCGGSSGSKGNDGGSQPGPDMTATSVPTNFASINSQILQFSCTFSTCHSPSGANSSGMLDLKDDSSGAGVKAFAQLVGVPSTNGKAAGQGLLRVKPCDADNSFLVTKLTLAKDLSATTDYGARMPDGSPALPDSDIQAIKDWINRGALEDEPATVSGSTCTLADGGTK